MSFLTPTFLTFSEALHPSNMGQINFCECLDDSNDSNGYHRYTPCGRARTLRDIQRMVTADSAMASSDEFLSEADAEALMRPNSTTTPQRQSFNEGFKDAVRNGNDSLTDFYLNEYPHLNLLQIPFENGDNCLHVAVSRKYYELTEKLLIHGADVKYNDSLSHHIGF